MGLVSEILLLPFAPARGVGWVLDKVVRAAEDEYYDPAPVQEALVNLERARDQGEVDEEEFAEQEEALLHRLEEITAYQLRQAGAAGP
ncbi:gas vesicle protein GvpG [Streptomyces sp. P17]|uniref:gas vesicle protein GvpG n=1 Tax=Streptomyces sp. P17 TaxID=3074716 RepID=UPI0028F457D4|nr:gas vesicle protein GvpG [Streptomyces sp. P17]MDT9701596.1 gas vesicle protein GvpG [Streptomyces sp. P17]